MDGGFDKKVRVVARLDLQRTAELVLDQRLQLPNGIYDGFAAAVGSETTGADRQLHLGVPIPASGHDGVLVAEGRGVRDGTVPGRGALGLRQELPVGRGADEAVLQHAHHPLQAHHLRGQGQGQKGPVLLPLSHLHVPDQDRSPGKAQFHVHSPVAAQAQPHLSQRHRLLGQEGHCPIDESRKCMIIYIILLLYLHNHIHLIYINILFYSILFYSIVLYCIVFI